MAKKASKIVQVLTRDGSERPVDLMECRRYKVQLERTWLTPQEQERLGTPPPKVYYLREPDFWFMLVSLKDVTMRPDHLRYHAVGGAMIDLVGSVDPEAEEVAYVETWGAFVARDLAKAGAPLPATLRQFVRQAHIDDSAFRNEVHDWLSPEFPPFSRDSDRQLRADRTAYILELRRTRPKLLNKEIAAMASRQFGVFIAPSYVSTLVTRHNRKVKKGDKVALKLKRKAR